MEGVRILERMERLSEEFWSNKYQTEATKWNAGAITEPLKAYIDTLPDKDIRILVPGVGHGHELSYLHKCGFTQVYAVDIALEPLKYIASQIPDFPEEHLIHGDFFDLEGTFDLILEQTFFCALEPNLRKDYAQKMNELLNDTGKLIGVLFNFPLDRNGLPPFGGSQQEYELLFSEYMRLIKIERCYNSIKPRANRELFIHIEKK